MTVERVLQLELRSLLFDRHSEYVGGALQKRDVVFAELARRPAVDFQHAERRIVALQNDVHGAANAVFDQQFRGPEPLLVLEMVGDDRLAGVQGEAGGRGHVGADRRDADDAFVPADAGAYQQPVFGRDKLENFAVFGLKAFGRQTGREIQQVEKRGALQCMHAEFCENFLLPKAQMQRPFGQVRRTGGGFRLDDRLPGFG